MIRLKSSGFSKWTPWGVNFDRGHLGLLGQRSTIEVDLRGELQEQQPPVVHLPTSGTLGWLVS